MNSSGNGARPQETPVTPNGKDRMAPPPEGPPLLRIRDWGEIPSPKADIRRLKISIDR
jgi:hypothetical protein